MLTASIAGSDDPTVPVHPLIVMAVTAVPLVTAADRYRVEHGRMYSPAAVAVIADAFCAALLVR